VTASFGARLRAQRERQHVALSDIAERTKIRQRLLDELEHDNVSHWPSGIFRRSYLRTYAQAIGLDPEATVREFLELYPDVEEDAPAVLAAAVSPPPTRLKYLIASALPQLFQAGQKETSTVAPEPSRVFAPAMATPRVSAAMPDPVHAERRDEAHEEVDDGIQPEAANDIPAPLERVVDERPSPAIDLTAMAQLCQELARARVHGDVAALMADAARILNAVGIILWMWDSKGSGLRPSLSHGYSRDVLAQLPLVKPDTENAIAAAFRSSDTRVVDGTDSATGAVVVPVVTPDGCAGVLALEFRDRGERHESGHALATILAAQLSILAEAPPVMRAATA